MNIHKQAVGIIGGMGPAATIDFMQRILDLTPAKDDKDHLHLLVESNTNIPSRIAALIDKTGESPLKELQETALRLQKQGASILAMPCNTAHHYYDDINKLVSVNFLNMIDLSVAQIASVSQNKRFGLMASTAVKTTKLYEKHSQKHQLNIIYPEPEEQEKIMSLIKNIKSNQHQPQEITEYFQIMDRLHKKGAEHILIACTELSILKNENHFDYQIIDALTVLSKKIIELSLLTKERNEYV